MSETKEEGMMLTTRVPRQKHTAFNEKAAEYGMTASRLMRELVDGMIDGRITIAPPKLYNQE
jgi:hypothetical protein